MPSELAQKGRRRVVVIGGGFGGTAAARALRSADVDVTLVDRTNHHLFQPLLYQVAAGGLSEGTCAVTTRALFRRSPSTTVLMATVTAIDTEGRQVELDSGESLEYDSLIVAAGARTSYFGHDDWADVSFGLKTLGDAVALRDHIFSAFEQAERATDAAEREWWLSFVVVGGGPTGVEISGQLAVLAKYTLRRDFRRTDTARARITLVDAGERLVPSFSPKLSAAVSRQLADLGVSVRPGALVTAIDRDGIELKVGERSERMAARTVIWAAGVEAAGISDALAAATGVRCDRGGRIEVEANCCIRGHPEISVIGDMARHPGPDGEPFPGLATVAIQQAKHVASGIAGGSPGASSPFRYFDKGALAVVGRGKAVCEVRGRQIAGRPAFFMYLAVHLYYLSGPLGHRLGVLRAWIGARFGNQEERVIEAELPGAK